MTTASALHRRAIIDVGSNSVRLVIYEGPARTPFVVHNEKIHARLGRELAVTGRIDRAAYDKAVAGCRRFKALLDAAGITDFRTVATAAARDAANGAELLDDLRGIGLRPELLSGDAEAYGSAAGVISAFPGADGIVGDLGGGSLELVDVVAGQLGQRQTLPLGVLRAPALRARGDKAFAAGIAKLLKTHGWRKAAAGRPFYLVGGSWRALGHLDMFLTGSALSGVHGYSFDRARIGPLRAKIAELGPRLSKTVPSISSSRAPVLDDAAVLLDAVGAVLGAGTLIVSNFGLREGLLFAALDQETQRLDPLMAAVRDYGQRHGNPSWNGDAVADWIMPLFADETPADARIRRAACHLAAVDLHPQSETRARHGMELAWLGDWIGIDPRERALLAQAMWTAWSGKGRCEGIGTFADQPALVQASCWGEAVRLAERFSGGVSAVLSCADLGRDDRGVHLSVAAAHRDLAGQIVAKQLNTLAEGLGSASHIITR